MSTSNDKKCTYWATADWSPTAWTISMRCESYVQPLALNLSPYKVFCVLFSECVLLFLFLWEMRYGLFLGVNVVIRMANVYSDVSGLSYELYQWQGIKKKIIKITTPKTMLVLTERKLDLGGEKLIFNETLSLNIILNKTTREEEKENFNTTECYFIYMLFFFFFYIKAKMFCSENLS